MQEVKKRILVVDDDEDFRLALKTCLESQQYETVAMANAKSAFNLLSIESFDAVVSDIRMPGMSGIELLHSIKKSKPMPVILMTGFAELTETREAYELGADKFIAKPFKREDLFEAVRACVGPAVDESQDQAANYCRLNIDDFVSGKEIQYDIFVKLSDAKFVKVAHQGENLSLERIRAYKAKGLKHLYMRKEDFKKYIGFNLSLASALKEARVPKAKKVNFMKHTGEVILEHIFNNELDETTYEDAKNIVETTVSIVTDNRDLFDLLEILNNHGDHTYAHSLGVSMYAAMMAKELKWNSPATLFKLSLGGMFHDIGLKEIEKELITKPRRNMNAEELKKYQSHPMRGMEILGQIPSIPSDVLQIVLQHHENCLGLGYPSGLKKKHIHPMARVVAVASEFCELALKGAHTPGLPPKEALSRLLTIHRETLDTAALEALLKVFKVPPPKELTEGGAGKPFQKSSAA